MPETKLDPTFKSTDENIDRIEAASRQPLTALLPAPSRLADPVVVPVHKSLSFSVLARKRAG
jgi:hypothetical protein